MRRMKDDRRREPDLFSRELNPADIIARAAATVPENRNRDSAKNRAVKETQDPAPPTFDTPRDYAPPPMPQRSANQSAKRRGAHRLVRRTKRTARAAIYASAGATLIAVPVWLWHNGTFNEFGRAANRAAIDVEKTAKTGLNLHVKDVLVIGRWRTPMAELRAAIEVKRGDDILAVDLKAVHARVAAHPWIKSASVERRLPNTILLRIVERKPIARYDNGLGRVLIGSDGEIIPTLKATKFRSLPLLAGAGAPKQARRLLVLLTSDGQLSKRVVLAHRIGNRRWDIVFDTGTTLRLPERGAIAAWGRFTTMEKRHRLLARGPVVLDMRLPDRLVITRPGTAGKQATKTTLKSG